MIKNNRYYTDEAINLTDNGNLSSILAQEIKAKTQPDNSISNLFVQNKPSNTTSNQSNSNNSSELGDVLGLGTTVLGIANGGGAGSLISNGLNAGKTALSGGSWDEDVPQSLFGVNSEDDSEIMQALKGTANGASMGMMFGPIGAIVGGVLGLGSSFLDDI